MLTAFPLFCLHLESRTPHFGRLNVGLSHGSEGRQLKSTNSSAGLIQNCLSTTQTHQELVYHRQLHGPSGKKGTQPLNWFQMFLRMSYLLRWKAAYLNQICSHLLCSSLPTISWSWRRRSFISSNWLKCHGMYVLRVTYCADKLQALQNQIYRENTC